jgi:hypothetical protein
MSLHSTLQTLLFPICVVTSILTRLDAMLFGALLRWMPLGCDPVSVLLWGMAPKARPAPADAPA